MWESPYLTCLFLYIFSLQIIVTNSRTSNVWKLNAEEDQIVDGSTLSQDDTDKPRMSEEDPVFNIITSTVYYGNTWTKHGFDMFCTDCQIYEQQRAGVENSDESTPAEINGDADDEYLDCGKAVNFTYYDNLVGVARRHRHPNVPEPQVSLIFPKKKSNGLSPSEINGFEKRLKKAKREKPKSVQLYNQIGNFWRIKGDTRQSIECFRRALAVSPYNAEILCALSFYRSGSYQRLVGMAKYLGQTTVSKYVTEVTNALNSPTFLNEFIRFPVTREERDRIKERFYTEYGIPGVIGCIDGSHFHIFTPNKEIEHLFFCRKQFYSLNVQMVLLNLARVLFTLQYLDDAIYLTRRSLEVQPPDRSAWQQYFTLGEIFKAYGHYQEAAMHLRHALDLKPDYEPALAALKDIENTPEASVHVYTLLIIVCLVMGVLLVILSSVDNGGDVEEHKTQRHFNRAMAMRSLRGVSLPGSRGRKKGGS